MGHKGPPIRQLLVWHAIDPPAQGLVEIEPASRAVDVPLVLGSPQPIRACSQVAIVKEGVGYVDRHAAFQLQIRGYRAEPRCRHETDGSGEEEKREHRRRNAAVAHVCRARASGVKTEGETTAHNKTELFSYSVQLVDYKVHCQLAMADRSVRVQPAKPGPAVRFPASRTLRCSQSSPSYRPCSETAEHGCRYQFWRSERRLSASATLSAWHASDESCLLASRSTEAFRSPSSASIACKVVDASDSRSGSAESTT